MYEQDKGKPKLPNEVFEHTLKSMLKPLGVDYTKIERCHWISAPHCKAPSFPNPMQNHLGEHLVVELSDNKTAEEMDDTCGAMGLDLHKSILITSTLNMSKTKQSDEPLYRGAVKDFMKDLLHLYTTQMQEDTTQIQDRDRELAQLVDDINRYPIFIAKLSTAACIPMNEVWDSDMNEREGYIPAAVVLFKASTTREHRFSERCKHGTDKNGTDPTKNIYRYFWGVLCCRCFLLFVVDSCG